MNRLFWKILVILRNFVVLLFGGFMEFLSCDVPGLLKSIAFMLTMILFLFICFLASIPVIIIMAIDSLFGFIKRKLKKPVLIRKGKKRKHD